MAWEILNIAPIGFNTDTSPASLPPEMTTAISNVDFYAGVARTLSPLAITTVPSTAPRAMGWYADSSYIFTGYCGLAGVFAWNAANAHLPISPVSGLSGSAYWDTTTFGSWFICTNDVITQAPHAISAAITQSGGKLAPLPGWQAGWDCTLIRTHRNVLWAGNMTEAAVEYPNRVRWSTSAPANTLPSTWVPAAGNDAGSNDLESSGRIVDLAAAGDVMFVGSTTGVWAARWVGGQYVYNFSQLSGIEGPRGLGCMESIGNAVAVLTQNDLLVVTESSQTSLGGGRILELIRTFTRATMLYVPPTRQLIIGYSIGVETEYNHALVWDRDTDTFGIRDFTLTPFTSLAAIVNPTVALRSVSYAGAAAPGIYLQNPAGTYAWNLERTNISTTDGDVLRTRSLEVDITGPIGATVDITLGAVDNPSSAPNWGTTVSYTVGNEVLRHDVALQGKYISYKLAGNASAKVNKVRLYYNLRESRP
jgi:hypothetical protein